jgi:menaquinone-9 beta-reductase
MDFEQLQDAGGQVGRFEPVPDQDLPHSCKAGGSSGNNEGSSGFDVSVKYSGEYHAAIAGGGPAGLACAIAAAQRGLRVVVVDGRKPPIDKACGEGLMPDTLAALAELGVQLTPEVGFPMRGIRFLNGAQHAEAEFPGTEPAGKELMGNGLGLGVKRVVLHERLLERAAELGVEFRWQTAIQGIEQGSEGATLWTNKGGVRARFAVGADGHQSRVRAAAGLEDARVSGRRIGLRQHFEIAPWTTFVEVYWSDFGQAYVTPVGPEEVCVAFLAQTKIPSILSALDCYPELRARLAGAPRSDAARGSVTISRRLERVTRGRVALAGDASGSVDAVTGEGLSLCFRQALVLAEAMQTKDLAGYERAHRGMLRMPHLMASTLLLLDRSPRLRSCAIGTLGRLPWVFERLLAAHIGDFGLTKYAATVSVWSDQLAAMSLL